MIKTKTNATFLLSGLILLLYSGVLITNNYRAQIELRKATMEQMRQVLEKQALSMGYFFSERKSDLRNLAQKRMVSAYFENLALGMSLEYGLRSSLNSIAHYFHDVVEEKEVGNEKIYSRIVLVDAVGALLADSRTQDGETRRGDWKMPQGVTHSAFFVEKGSQDSPQVIISRPYYFKEQYAGQILAWLNPGIPYEYFLSSREPSEDRINALLLGLGQLHFSADTPGWAAAFIQENSFKLGADTFKEHMIIDRQGVSHEVLVSKIAVQGTPFFLINILRSSALIGKRSPVYLLVAMGLLTVVVLVATSMLWRIKTNNLVLQARIREADIRKAEIEEKNILLQKEIAERREAEQKNKKLAEQLLHAQKMEAIGTLAGGIAHDFNNILTAVLGFSELAKMHRREEEDIAADLDGITQAGLRARELVRQILAFSRRGEHRREVFSPAPLIKESLKLLRASVPSTIEIHEEIDGWCGAVLAEPTMIQQIVMNLCTNAVQAMEDEQGTLTVQLTRRALDAEDLKGESGVAPGEFVELLVSDTGKGMDETILSRIYEPYFTTKEVGKGTGMGLALVHGIVQNCGGLVRMESEKGRGSTFYIFLPVAKMTGKVTTVPEQPDFLSGGREHILCIDDESTVVNVMEGLLSHLGYRVTTTTSAVEGLHIFRENPGKFDLIITDQTMPRLTGLEIARQVLGIRPDIPVILCSGYSPVISEERIRAAGIRAFVMKPLEKGAFSRLVRSVLDSPEKKFSEL